MTERERDPSWQEEVAIGEATFLAHHTPAICVVPGVSRSRRSPDVTSATGAYSPGCIVPCGWFVATCLCVGASDTPVVADALGYGSGRDHGGARMAESINIGVLCNASRNRAPAFRRQALVRLSELGHQGNSSAAFVWPAGQKMGWSMPG